MFGYIIRKIRGSSLKKLNETMLKESVEDKKYNEPISTVLERNLEIIKGILRDSSDVTFHEFNFGHERRFKGALIFINSMADKVEIHKNILQPLMYDILLLKKDVDMDFTKIDNIRKNIISITDNLKVTLLRDVIENLFSGATILLIDGSKEALAVKSGKPESVL